MSKATQRATSRPALPSPSPSPPALQPRPHRGGAAGLGHGGGGLGLEGGDQHRFHCSEEVLSSGDEGRPLSGTVTVITIVIITNVVITIVAITIVVIIASSIHKLKIIMDNMFILTLMAGHSKFVGSSLRGQLGGGEHEESHK